MQDFSVQAAKAEQKNEKMETARAALPHNLVMTVGIASRTKLPYLYRCQQFQLAQ
jgi:hypothetical protein